MNKSRIVALLALCLLLTLPGQAQEHVNIGELRTQAAQGWAQTYESRGRAIQVDVQPLVPQVDAVPLLKVSPAVALITLPGEDPLWSLQHSDHLSFVLIYRPDATEEPAGHAVVDGRPMSAKPYNTLYRRAYAGEEQLIPGNPLAFGQVTELMAQGLRVAGLAQDVIDLPHPDQVMTFGYYDKSPDVFHSPGWAAFQWPVLLRGIPAMAPTAVPFKQGADEPSLLRPSMSMVIRRLDLFWLGGMVLKESQVLEEDLPLLPFAQVVAGYEAQIAAGRVRHVFDMRLGYALQPQANQTRAQRLSEQGVYYAKPYWQLECLWGADPKEATTLPVTEGNGPFPDPRNNISRVTLLMDAQTGDIVDPMNNAYDRAEYKGILTWAQVGGQ